MEDLPDYEIGKYFEKCLEAVVYHISEYKVDGTTLHNFQLTFYKDTLIRIYTEDRKSNEEFIRVFKSKYGEGEVVNSDRPSKEFPDKKNSYTVNLWKPSSSDMEIKLFQTLSYVEDDNYFGSGSHLYEGFKFYIQNSHSIIQMHDCQEKGQTSK